MALVTTTLAVLILITLLLSAGAAAAAAPPFSKIYAFGDSYTDTGNTRTSTGPAAFNHVSNPPYGITFFHHSTNRYSDGRIIIDFVAETLSLSFLPPYRHAAVANHSHGLNFAVAGATAIRQGFFLKNNITFNLVGVSLQTQLVWFNRVLADLGCTAGPCHAALGNTLIWLGEIGANDYTCSLGTSIPVKAIQTIAVKSVTGFLQALIDRGAMYIVVQGLPPTGCTTYAFSLANPDDRDRMGCVGSMNRQVASHNAAMLAALAALRRRNPSAVIAYADFFNAHLALLRDAPRYGFRERYRACCGYGGGEYNFDVFNTCGSPATASACYDPSRYINWDGAHFTEAANKAITESFLNGSYCRPPFSYLVAKRLQSSSPA